MFWSFPVVESLLFPTFFYFIPYPPFSFLEENKYHLCELIIGSCLVISTLTFLVLCNTFLYSLHIYAA